MCAMTTTMAVKPEKLMIIFLFCFLFLFMPHMAYAWGPGVHTLISFNLLDELKICGSSLYPIVSNNFWEFLYGSLAPDFMVARKFVSIENNSHNFDFAYNLFNLSKSDKELSFALGYLSHLASDKIMHEKKKKKQNNKSPPLTIVF